MTTYTDAQVAEICHEANRALQIANGDAHVSPHWSDLPGWWHASAIFDVGTARAGQTPQGMHAIWRQRKLAQGWTWGPVRDETAKTHPCLVDTYDELPAAEQMKDTLYLAIVTALDGRVKP